MTLRPALLASAWAVLLAAAPSAVGQAPPAGPPLTPAERFGVAREHVLDARFELAAEELKAFLAANPTDADLFAIQNRYGPAVFERLKAVPLWSEEPAANAEAVKTVDAIVTRAREANKKFFRDPARIKRFVLNLGQSTEERIFAEQQLRQSGDAVVRPMLDELRGTDDQTLRAGILGAVRRLGPDVVPGMLGGLDSLPDDKKAALLEAVVGRTDVYTLTANADTDPLPFLWYYASAPVDQVVLRTGATILLDQLVGNTRRRQADAELVALARPAYDHTAKFAAYDAVTKQVSVWAWDDAAKELKTIPMSRTQAEEFFGLRDLRWALERNPANVAAQDLYLSLAADRAVDRSKYGVLMTAEPGVYQLLAAAPTTQLARLLDSAIRGQRSAEVMGFTQALADRADRATAAPTEVRLADGKIVSKPPILVKALDYPDPRIQLAAAIGLLRAPGPATHGKQARVIEVLRRALAAEPPTPGTTDKGRALIGDPSDARGEKVAGYLRALGYSTERFPTGKDLLRRVARASDFDVIVLDRHTGGPMVPDVLASLKADANAARRPVLLVASPDKTHPVPLEMQLLRLAILVAVTEIDEPPVPAPFFIDPRKPPVADIAAAREEVRLARDAALGTIAATRLARLRRLVQASDFPPSSRLAALLDLRLPQLTYAVLTAEFPVSADSAPVTLNSLVSYTQRIQTQPLIASAADGVSTTALGRIIEELELALDTSHRTRSDAIRRRLDPVALLLPPDIYRDRDLERQLVKVAATTPGVTVVPEPWGLNGLTEEIQAATEDPATTPRDPAAKKVAAKFAVEWLRRIALGDVAGYDVRPAEPALRAALKDDDLADPAVDALARISSAETQQDLLALALDTKRPLPLRMKAADRTVLHMQAFGKFIPANLAAALGESVTTEPPGDLRGKLLLLHQLVSGKPEDLPKMFNTYRPRIAGPPAVGEPAPAPADAKPPAEPKN